MSELMGTERISWKEAEQVVRLWRQENGASSTISLNALAASLSIEADEAMLLLERTRDINAATEPGSRRFTDRSGILSFAVGGGLAACFAAAWAWSSFHKAPAAMPTAIVEVAEPMMPTAPASFRIQLDPKISGSRIRAVVNCEGKSFETQMARISLIAEKVAKKVDIAAGELR